LIYKQETVLFADLCGSTKLYEEMGDKDAFNFVSDLFRIISEKVMDYNGRLIKTIGDEMMFLFPTPRSAVSAAISIQNICQDLSERIGKKIEMRIGLNSGALRHEGGDVFGNTVNTASRLVKFASPSKIITSEDTIRSLAKVDISFRSIGHHYFKGKKESIQCFEITWQLSNLTECASVAKREMSSKIIIRHGGHIWNFSSYRILSIGAGKDNDLRMNAPGISKRHATIEKRRSSFSLIDESTNGTFLIIDNNPPVHLHHEEHSLIGSGQILLGSDLRLTPESVIKYTTFKR
jgi:adenylate cyclase